MVCSERVGTQCEHCEHLQIAAFQALSVACRTRPGLSRQCNHRKRTIATEPASYTLDPKPPKPLNPKPLNLIVWLLEVVTSLATQSKLRGEMETMCSVPRPKSLRVPCSPERFIGFRVNIKP